MKDARSVRIPRVARRAAASFVSTSLASTLAWTLAACGSDSTSPAAAVPGDAAVEATVTGAGDAGAAGDAGGPIATGDAGAPIATGDAGADAGPTRTTALALGGVQLLVHGSPLGLQITPADLAADADVVEIHQEFYGIPWDTFAAGTAPPAEWKAKMDSLAAGAANKPVFLSVTMLNGGRDHLAARTVIENGDVKSADDTSVACYDFKTAADAATKRQAYLRYVDFMIDEFNPRWLDVAVEVNLFFEKCPSAIDGLVDVANAAYDAAKAKRPGMVVFPSVQIDHLYGYSSDSCPGVAQRQACFDRAYAQIAPLKRDRFAMSTYPMLGVFSGPADLPSDWFTRGSSRGGERPLVAETGWNSTPMVLQPRGAACATLFSADVDAEAAYLGRVLDAAAAANMDLVNWWSDRDLVVPTLMTDCPCTFDATWCSVLDIFRGPPTDAGPDTQLLGELALKAFGVMGLRDYDGVPKSAVMARWTAARALPLAP